MRTRSVASIIVNNYNYARFLREAIDSALSQTYPSTEIIVVDDGSTDGSQEIIAGYGARVVPLLKENGGQNSAFNAGFSISRGEAIFFLDSDDVLLPTAVEAAMEGFREQGVAKVHWPLVELDAASRQTGRVWDTNHRGASTLSSSSVHLPARFGEEPVGLAGARPGVGRRAMKRAAAECIEQEDAQNLLLREGPDSVPYPPTSGNAFSRTFLENVFPLPDVKCESNSEPWRTRPGPDVYLSTLAPLYGRIMRLPEPQACYRVHGQNGYASLGFEDRLRFDSAIFDFVSSAVLKHCTKLRAGVDPGVWMSRSWSRRIYEAIQTIAALVPRSAAFILVDEDSWGTEPFLLGRKRIPFLEQDGQYWGNPADDATAIRELQRLRESGASFIIFAWPAFWWLDYYGELHNYLRARFPLIHQDDQLLVFNLRPAENELAGIPGWGRTRCVS